MSIKIRLIAALLTLSWAQATPTSQPTPAAHAPPIDCPLHKHKHEHGRSLKGSEPFEETARYIDHLERADRAAWQKPDAVVRALGLKGQEVVMDIGAGSGYFSFRFAQALPLGRVIAADVRPEMIQHVRHKATLEGIKNVEASLLKHDDPGVPEGVDLIFICDVLHHVADRPAWLAKLYKQAAPGAQVALIEFRQGPLPLGPPEEMKIARATLLQELKVAGFQAVTEHKDLLPHQIFLVFKKPEVTPSTEALAIEELIVESQKAGIERGDFEAYIAPWALEARWVQARAAEPGPYDNVMGLSQARARAEIRRKMATPLKMQHEDIQVRVEGDKATVQLTLIIRLEEAKYWEKAGEIYQLVRREGAWRIVENRYWPVAQRVGGSFTLYNEAHWRALDGKVDAARRAGDRGAEAEALTEATRWPEALVAARVWARAASKDVAPLRLTAQAAYTLGWMDEAKAAIRQAQALDPQAQLPPWAQLID